MSCIKKTNCKQRNAANTETSCIQKTTVDMFPADTESAEHSLDTLVSSPLVYVVAFWLLLAEQKSGVLSVILMISEEPA